MNSWYFKPAPINSQMCIPYSALEHSRSKTKKDALNLLESSIGCTTIARLLDDFFLNPDLLYLTGNGGLWNQDIYHSSFEPEVHDIYKSSVHSTSFVPLLLSQNQLLYTDWVTPFLTSTEVEKYTFSQTSREVEDYISC